MKMLPGVAAICLVLVLLTWLLRGTATDAPGYAATLQVLDNFALAEASLQRDALRARAGLLRNYDSLNNALEQMNTAVAQLRSTAQEGGLDIGQVDYLAAAAAREEELTERFKSSNALLQNSLSYVSLLSTSPDFVDQNAQLAPAIGALAAAILHLTLDSSRQSTQTVQDRLDQLAAQAPSTGPRAVGAGALVAHARLLDNVLPTVDETLKALLAAPTRQPLEATRTLFSDGHLAVEARGQHFRLLLYAVSLLLLLALVELGRRLRARARALRQRAAFEHVIAKNSTRLINCPPAETEARLKQVLKELCQAIGADRAYIVLDERPARVHVWGADSSPYPLGWPERVLALSLRNGMAGPDIVTVPDVATLPQGEFREGLSAAKVLAWGCVPLIRAGRVRGIMAFEATQPARSRYFPVPVMRLAGDAVTNAIDREFLERDRARLMRRLERARRLQMVGQLASGIAHNFNNIIGAILGHSEMAEGELTPGTKPARHIEEIHQAAERGRDLIDSILTFGRRRGARSRPVPVRALLDEAGSLLRASLPQGIELAIGDAPADIAILGEPVQLHQIILNLVNNASQAMEGKGRIEITAEMQDAITPKSLSHGELAPGTYVRLAVSDSGSGFDENVARQLFEPFFTTRMAGTGLGLATVREIVRDHEGAMNVSSIPGQGSRFESWLPATATGISSALRQGEAAPLPLGQGETVLVVEKDRSRLLGGEEMLAALGYEPVGFERPADALAAGQAAPQRFDAILISYASAAQALDLARSLHDAMPRQPILLATASAIDIGLDRLTTAGVAELLRRPLGSAELAAALARCLSSRPQHARKPTASV